MDALLFVTVWMTGRSLLEAPHDRFIRRAMETQRDVRVRYTVYWHRWDVALIGWSAACLVVALHLRVEVWPEGDGSWLAALLAALLAGLLVVQAGAVRWLVFNGWLNVLNGRSFFYVGSTDDLDRMLRRLPGHAAWYIVPPPFVVAGAYLGLLALA